RAEAHAILTRQLQQMVRLIDDLLDLSRITRNKLELRRERVDLTTVLQDAAETARPLIEDRQHRLVIHHVQTPLMLHADRARLGQVFSNLLSNAAKFTAQGGSIEVTVAREGPEGVVRVRDTGIGIPPEMLPRIFDMFVQADRSLERTQSGLGIGLTLVRRVVQMHGGRVEARSGGRGKGSVFTVRIPAEPETTVTRSMRDEPGRDDASGALEIRGPRRRVLVADDNEDAVRSLSLMLRAMGHEVVTAQNGEEAVRLAETSRPDLALLDIGMPLLNGYDAARRIREQPWGGALPLVALTGWGLEEDRRQAKESGFDRHIVKPVDVGTLRTLISELPEKGARFPRPTEP
ncbi:MAG TPA: ATP-binding protein, partial [Candidatus Eisenbacteria bacterium]|nr:ATP-binding protein [Candidatus Eisenbacteria bacterium]